MKVELQPLPPKEAIAFFRSKGLEPRFAWQDVWQQEHAKAFTVAKMMQRDLLEETRAAVDQAISEGQTLEQFKAGLKPKLQKAGWWGKQQQTDPATGEEKLVQLGSDRRLRTIYQVNLRSAYAHGNWQRIERNKAAFPYLVYTTAGDFKVRVQHRAWAGICLPVDHEFWNTHYPPCGWRCRCGTISLTRRMYETRKGSLITTPPKFEPVVHLNERTGELIEIEKGIDPGFNFNVGKAPLRPLSARPGHSPAPLPNPRAIEEGAAEFLTPMSASDTDRVVVDKGGWPVVVGPSLFRDGANRLVTPRPDLLDKLPLAAEALKSYDQVDWVWSSPARTAELANIDHVLKARTQESVRLTAMHPAVVKALTAEGEDFKGYVRTLTTDAVAHIRKNHGTGANELARGQLPIGDEDIRSVTDIAAHAEYIIVGLLDDRRQPTLVYVSRFKGDHYVLVETIAKRRREVSVKTMWKRPARVDAVELVEGLVHNARDGGRHDVKVLDVRQKINPDAQFAQQLVRRYTKRLDSSVVTVDFSAEVWTYDVQPIKGN